MSLFTAIKKKTTLSAATNQIGKARKAQKGKAEQLYKSAYEGFEFVLSDNLMLADALYNWGFGLLNQAKTKEGQQAIELYEEAINKYSFCLTVEPYYLGAAVEGGVAYMDIARIKGAAADDLLYHRAKACFKQAGTIQKGSGAFNFACLYSIENNHEACLASLKEAKEYAHLPDEADILNDPDMKNVIETPWFLEFMEGIKVEQAAIENAAAEKKKAKAEAKLRAGGATNVGKTESVKADETPVVDVVSEKTDEPEPEIVPEKTDETVPEKKES
ncbi:MAG: hypothetical protein Q9M50_13465 [Methylococcales bacterium]|nr:hypothetical protein [Methylococcales bacterium]